MARYHTRIEESPGLNEANLAGSQFAYIQGFSLLNLQGGTAHRFEPGAHETGVMILSGTCEVSIDGAAPVRLGTRQDVFSGKPSAFYVPRDTPFAVVGAPALLAVCRAKCDQKTSPAIICPENAKVMSVGNDNWAREVRIVIGPDAPSVNLILGETLNPPGNWSGTPPHKHEGKVEGESLHEELYYFRTDKPQGWGIERLYSPERNVNELTYLTTNAVTFMPWGYHQIVAAPGYTLYYLFFLAGEGKTLSGLEDPAHNWIKQAAGGGK